MNLEQKIRSWPRWMRATAAFGLGMLAAVCAHYLLYRLSLPSTPFIYVAF